MSPFFIALYAASLILSGVSKSGSPTLKLIVDREREIDEFIPEDYWEIFAKQLLFVFTVHACL